MKPSPPAEIDPDADDVRQLLAEQLPHLAALPLAPLGHGWDNLIFRLGADLAVRIPRRSVAVALARREQRWLAGLAARLPCPVPAPIHVGRPGPGVPWMWSVVPWIPGDPADRRDLRPDVIETLASVFRALHAPAPPDAPLNPVRGVPLMQVVERTHAALDALQHEVDAAPLRTVLARGCQAVPHEGPPLWIHGDPHPANVVVGPDGGLRALIDWGDVAAGDPATDLAAVWMLFGPDQHARFWRAYGSDDEALRLRSRAWAVRFGAMLLQIGRQPHGPHPTYATAGRRTLARILAEASGAATRC